MYFAGWQIRDAMLALNGYSLQDGAASAVDGIVATRFQLGDVTITRVEEVLEKGFRREMLFPGIDLAIYDEHPVLRDFYDAESGQVWSSIHSWLVQADGLNILVDTCSGNGKARALPRFQRFHMLDLPFMENLGRAGLKAEDIDIVFCTHLHIDHVGWNTRREGDRWVPAFPNARYIFGRREFAHWTEGEGPGIFPENVAVIEDSVMPVVEAGLVEFVDDGDEIAPGLRVEAAPGHTPTQLILKHERPGSEFVISADCIHQPVQVYAPHLNSCFCEDQESARTTRRALLDYCADADALLLPMHFGPPHAGRIRRAGSGFAFEPAAASA